MDDSKLKPVKTQSVKSLRSVKAIKSALEYNIAYEKPLDLDDFMAIACRKYYCPYKIIVKKDAQSGKRMFIY